jgi:hypothetical protein
LIPATGLSAQQLCFSTHSQSKNWKAAAKAQKPVKYNFKYQNIIIQTAGD